MLRDINSKPSRALLEEMRLDGIEHVQLEGSCYWLQIQSEVVSVFDKTSAETCDYTSVHLFLLRLNCSHAHGSVA